ISVTNETAQAISLDDISADLRFADGDRWELEHFDGRFLEARLHVSASITNASAIRGWSWGGATPESAKQWPQQIDRWIAHLKQVELPATSVLALNLQGDGGEPASFHGNLKIQAPWANTPWGRLDNARFNATLTPALSAPGVVETEVHLAIDAAHTKDRQWTMHGGTLTLKNRFSLTNQVLISAMMDCQLGQAETRWSQVTNIHLRTDTSSSGDHSDLSLRTRLSVDADAIDCGVIHTR